jgi:hypothetical protein
MQRDDELNNLLNKRAVPPRARADLAERIIHAAISQTQERPRAQNFWNELMQMFAIPHPSVAVAAGIILGLMMGIQAGDGLAVLQQDWSSFLYINEGGWL